jgi:hypothetical protein
VEAVAAGQRVVLPPGTQLQFVLGGAPAAPSAAALAAPGGAAPAASQPRSAYFCQASWPDNASFPSAYYYTDVFPAAANLAPVQDAWRLYLAKAYSGRFNLKYYSAWCSDAGPPKPGQTYEQSVRNEANAKAFKAHNVEVVHANWEYTPDQAAAAPAKPAQTAAPAPGAANPATTSSGAGGNAIAYCWSDLSQSPAYFSEAIDTGVRDSSLHGLVLSDVGGDFTQAFLKFLERKYSYRNNSDPNHPAWCASFNDGAQAQADKQGKQAYAKQHNLQIVETGWRGEEVNPAVYCASNEGNSVVYFSDNFAQSRDARSSRKEMAQAFFEYLKKTYSYPGDYPNGQCVPTYDLATSRAAREHEEAATKNQRLQVKETGWKYEAIASTPAVAGAGWPGSMEPMLIKSLEEEQELALYQCQSGELHGTYDCHCFTDKLRVYRTQEYRERGSEMLSSGRRGRLSPPFNNLLSRATNPEFNFSSCKTN